jgi:phosphinothricin acetyltransferase
VTVAVHDGCVVGWGALSAFRNRSAYRFSVETSVYVHAEWHGRGIGTALLLDLVERGRALGHHAILALIDSGQTASLSLHAKCGFVEVGRLPQIGFKFDHWLDVVIMECMLGGR